VEEAENSLPFKGRVNAAELRFPPLQGEEAETSLPFKGRVRVGMGYHSNLTKQKQHRWHERGASKQSDRGW
jgi:hypothetical protein